MDIKKLPDKIQSPTELLERSKLDTHKRDSISQKTICVTGASTQLLFDGIKDVSSISIKDIISDGYCLDNLIDDADVESVVIGNEEEFIVNLSSFKLDCEFETNFCKINGFMNDICIPNSKANFNITHNLQNEDRDGQDGKCYNLTDKLSIIPEKSTKVNNSIPYIVDKQCSKKRLGVTHNEQLSGIENQFLNILNANKIRYGQTALYNQSGGDTETSVKYTNSFLDHPTVQEKMFQQNMEAKVLINKYFNNIDEEICPRPLLHDEVETNALIIINRVESLLKTFNSESEDNEMISNFLEPFSYKDYLAKLDHTYTNQKQEYNISHFDESNENNGGSVLITNLSVKPYESNHSNVGDIEEQDFDNLYEPSIITFDSDSSVNNFQLDITNTFDLDISSTNESFQFPRFLNTIQSNRGSNKILFKNKSDKFNTDVSSDTISDFDGRLLSKKCFSLKRLEELPRINITRSRSKKNGKKAVGLRISKNYKINVNDSDYRNWLKKKNLNRYTELSETPETSSIVTTTLKTNLSSQSMYSSNIDYSILSCFYRCNQYYEIILYEHIVLLNAIHFFFKMYYTKKVRGFSGIERILQILFLYFCYYITTTVNNSGIGRIARNLDVMDVIKYKRH